MGRVSAKVFNVFAGGVIAIDAGKAKGVTKKTQLSVLRNGKVIARVVATEVYDSFSIAEQDSKIDDKQMVSVGDDVISY